MIHKQIAIFVLFAAFAVWVMHTGFKTYYADPESIDYCRFGTFSQILPDPYIDPACPTLQPDEQLVAECNNVSGRVRPILDDDLCVLSYYCERCGNELDKYTVTDKVRDTSSQTYQKLFSRTDVFLIIMIVLLSAMFVVAMRYQHVRTYAIAAAVVILVMGAAYQYGLFDTSRVKIERCDFGSTLMCNEFIMQYNDGTDATISLQLQNNELDPIIVSAWSFNFESVELFCTNMPDPNTRHDSGVLQDYVFSGCDIIQAGIEQGKKETIDISVDYYDVKTGSSFTKTIKGVLTVLVQ